MTIMEYYVTSFCVKIDDEFVNGFIGSITKGGKPNPNILSDRIIRHYRKDYPNPHHTVALIPLPTAKNQLVSKEQYAATAKDCIAMD